MGASAVDFPEVDDDFCGSGDGDAGSEIGLRESTAEYRDEGQSSRFSLTGSPLLWPERWVQRCILRPLAKTPGSRPLGSSSYRLHPTMPDKIVPPTAPDVQRGRWWGRTIRTR